MSLKNKLLYTGILAISLFSCADAFSAAERLSEDEAKTSHARNRETDRFKPEPMLLSKIELLEKSLKSATSEEHKSAIFEKLHMLNKLKEATTRLTKLIFMVDFKLNASGDKLSHKSLEKIKKARDAVINRNLPHLSREEIRTVVTYVPSFRQKLLDLGKDPSVILPLSWNMTADQTFNYPIAAMLSPEEMASYACTKQVVSLSLDGSVDQVKALVRNGHRFPNLISVGFSDLSPEALKTLADWKGALQLKYFNTKFMKLNRETVQVLSTSPNLGNLTTLASEMGAEAIKALAKSPYLSKVSHLDLGYSEAGPEGAQALAHSPTFANLTYLRLMNSHMGDGGAAALASSPHMRHIEELDVSDNKIGPKGAQALATSPIMDTIKILNLGKNPIGPRGAQAVATSPRAQNLERLSIYDSDISGAGIEAIAKSPYMGNLKYLNARQVFMGDAGAIALATSKYLVNLTEIYIQENEIRDAGADALINSTLPKLSEVHVSFNNMSEAKRAALAKRYQTDL